MKKIGFIDLFLDEWHANNYPKMFREAPRAGEFELGLAWEEKTKEGGRPLEKWCEDYRMTPAKSLEEVVEKSDCICVLAPSNPEEHERLADLPLRSGKPVYIDKPFADSKAAAERLFALAEKHGTPLMSSSALRFGDQLMSGKIQALKPILFSAAGCGKSYEEYGIHQLEMIVSVMGTDVREMKMTGDAEKLLLAMKYGNGNVAQLTFIQSLPFGVTASNGKETEVCPQMTNTFPNLIAAIMDFFATGKSIIPKEQTICIADLLEKSVAMLHSMK
ncbi:MAG: Gfo/Idh/MocA family oxidoreductase [Lentisphaeria bacterium]|nr:Gfo/Idh/MocA family oxidoreductase [Lentisphaeria bacterium]